DFAKGTSSRSTKLVHGGVRYLAQGNIRLVREALRERGILIKNAPHLVRNETFIVPCYRQMELLQYGLGLKCYDLLAGKLSFGKSERISASGVAKHFPNIRKNNLRGGVRYHDGQFDDARLAINLAQTAAEQGAVVLNYVKVTGLLKEHDRVAGVTAKDIETGREFRLKAKVVINATGVFVDALLQMDQPGTPPFVKPSQGVHLVLDRSFLASDDALVIPKTEDGRVLFAVPWHHRVVVGTTDTPLNEHSLEPVALETEIGFILRTAEQYFIRTPQRRDILSVFAGLRPLAAPQKGNAKTKEISRNHKLIVSASRLVTITGGKWTTYRLMAEDTVDKAMEIAGLPAKKCVTQDLRIHGYLMNTDWNDDWAVYGSDAPGLYRMTIDEPRLKEKIHPRLEYQCVQVIWAVRNEMACTVDDVLARRTRALFLDAQAAIESAPLVASIMAVELKKDAAWEQEQIVSFRRIASGYVIGDSTGHEPVPQP
ncbi:MAG TPA: glycerol-3-phosphate dehydrogenase/oxidase, partial [Puia sp.]|nr:glycerol-3-phosphate dehydrogenase/oxidase [Puia sp.]